MNCTEMEERLIEIARGKDANLALRKQALLHVRSCSRCGDRLDGEQGLNDLLDALRVEMQLEAAPSAIETLLLAEFRRQLEGVPSVSTAFQRRSYISRWLVAAAAILIVFACGILALRFGQSEQQPAPPRTDKVADVTPAVPRPAPVSEEKNQAIAAVSAQPGPAPRKNQHLSRSPEAVEKTSLADDVEPAAGEITTEFFPINGFSDFSYVDSAQILRVKLPRTTLVTFGLPVDPNREDQRVTADVLMTSDGLARAIRFVR